MAVHSVQELTEAHGRHLFGPGGYVGYPCRWFRVQADVKDDEDAILEAVSPKAGDRPPGSDVPAKRVVFMCLALGAQPGVWIVQATYDPDPETDE